MPGECRGDEPLKHVGKRRVRVSGRFFPQGAGALVASTNQGRKGWSVARTSAGLFTLTLDSRPLKLILLGLGIQKVAAGVALWAEWGTVVFNANGTTSVQIRLINATGTATDMAADANSSISFELEAMQDTVAG